MWGVKFTGGLGWFGWRHPFGWSSEEEARTVAARLNAREGAGTWEARPLAGQYDEPTPKAVARAEREA
jgi:hypothetical protein